MLSSGHVGSRRAVGAEPRNSASVFMLLHAILDGGGGGGRGTSSHALTSAWLFFSSLHAIPQPLCTVFLAHQSGLCLACTVIALSLSGRLSYLVTVISFSLLVKANGNTRCRNVHGGYNSTSFICTGIESKCCCTSTPASMAATAIVLRCSCYDMQQISF